ncbi:MAG: type IV pilus modification PilV family protein [Desulfitobacteriaceae bacterium]
MARTTKSKGYVLLDALMAVFFFSLGFAVLFGLTESAVRETESAQNLTQAANLAQQKIERLAAKPWSQNLAQGLVVPGASILGEEGKFNWIIDSDWEIPSLLKVTVQVSWPEQGKTGTYTLGSVFYVQ